MTYYEYIEKAKCSCGYIWTTKTNDAVRCACGELLLDGSTLTEGVSLEVNEVEFKNKIAEDLQINSEDLVVIRL